MPWKETSTMDQRMLFIADYLSDRYNKKALCIHYGVSPPSGERPLIARQPCWRYA